MAASPAAVITGDIVKSGTLSAAELDAVMAGLGAAAADIAAWPDTGVVHYERYRGDGWQMYLAHPGQALRAALAMRAAVRVACEHAETRLALGIGDAALADSLGASTGAAFERSGRALDELAAYRCFVFGGRLASPDMDRLLDALMTVCDDRSQQWTARQAEIAAILLAPAAPSMVALAARQGVQQQTIQTHFDRAGGHALRDAIQACEHVMT